MTLPLVSKARALYGGHKRLFWVLGALLLLALPLLVRNNYLCSILIKILLYVMLASSLNLINGYSGQLNIGQASFYAIGSYTAGILATRCGVSFWLLLPICGAVTALFGFLISIPTRKLAGVYLALVTLGFSEITRLIILNWNALTGGPMGIKDIPRATLFGMAIKTPAQFYYVGLALAALTIFLIRRVVKSNIGLSWISIREDETAAKFLGVNVNRLKSLNFAFGAFFAGIAGCYSTYYYQFISSDMFTPDEGFNILAMVIIGGQGTLVGPVIGAVIVNCVTELFRFASEYRLVAYGMLIIAMMWLRPQGIAGDSNSIFASRVTRNRPGRRRGAARAGEGGGT